MKKAEKKTTYRKIPWIFFFIVLFSSVSVCLLFIPYSETKVISEGGILATKYNLSSDNPYAIFPIDFPWRSNSQIIFLNITVTEGNISLQITDTIAIGNFLSGQPYVSYWEIINTTGFTTDIQISPSAYGPRYILIYAEINAWFTIELKIIYLTYASTYGFFFLGVAVILIFYYIYHRNIWKIHSEVEEKKML